MHKTKQQASEEMKNEENAQTPHNAEGQANIMKAGREREEKGERDKKERKRQKGEKKGRV
jgi:hypothetical protein